MSNLYLLHKPFHVLSQFSDREGRQTLAHYIDVKIFILPGGLTTILKVCCCSAMTAN
ncbi:hypothetical protein HSBAA_17580 [Vreelandella sulfidaeris]|uniref:Uncharacterized protein n=1 Tax=Vreelandella sulfidaeris TaxID=115553 RepID=A0A455U331_9GAMM|nr:hypothetical protein HSBAA_17580 [Halomonas sulfidaeris]